MSLINQALRKAQRDRTPNRMPQPGDPPPAAYATNAASGLKPTLVIGLVLTVAVLIGLVVGLSIAVFKDDVPAEPAAPAPVASAPEETPAAAPPTPEPVVQQAAPIEPQTPPSAAPSVAQEAPPAPSVVEELRKVREAAEAAAVAKAKAAEEAAARAAAKPSEDIIEWLGLAKIAGVKISDTESKVILNGEAYAVGEYVNFKLGLKVMIIQEQRVLFVDNNGKKYMKRL